MRAHPSPNAWAARIKHLARKYQGLREAKTAERALKSRWLWSIGTSFRGGRLKQGRTFVAQHLLGGGFGMPVVVAVHHLKNFDEWFKLFKSNFPPKVGRWRVFRGSEDRNRVHVVAELTASEVKDVKDFIQSKHMEEVFKQVNDMSTTPIKFIWLEELSLTSLDKAPLAIALGEW
jgi:hypothetical protein